MATKKTNGSPHKRREMLAEHESAQTWRCVSRYRKYESVTHVRTGTSDDYQLKPVQQSAAVMAGPLEEWHVMNRGPKSRNTLTS